MVTELSILDEGVRGRPCLWIRFHTVHSPFDLLVGEKTCEKSKTCSCDRWFRFIFVRRTEKRTSNLAFYRQTRVYKRLSWRSRFDVRQSNRLVVGRRFIRNRVSIDYNRFGKTRRKTKFVTIDLITHSCDYLQFLFSIFFLISKVWYQKKEMSNEIDRVSIFSLLLYCIIAMHQKSHSISVVDRFTTHEFMTGNFSESHLHKTYFRPWKYIRVYLRATVQWLFINFYSWNIIHVKNKRKNVVYFMPALLIFSFFL